MKLPGANVEISVDVADLVKHWKKGEIHIVYQKMHKVAERLVAKETKSYILELRSKFLEDTINDFNSETQTKGKLTLLSRITEYQKKRLEYHMNEMKRLLELRLKEESN